MKVVGNDKSLVKFGGELIYERKELYWVRFIYIWFFVRGYWLV